MFIQGVKVTKTYKIAGFNIASKWKRKLHGCSPKEGWIILTSLDNLTEAIRTYKKRFKRCDPGRVSRPRERAPREEEMFRYFKSGGYNARRY